MYKGFSALCISWVRINQFCCVTSWCGKHLHFRQQTTLLYPNVLMWKVMLGNKTTQPALWSNLSVFIGPRICSHSVVCHLNKYTAVVSQQPSYFSHQQLLISAFLGQYRYSLPTDRTSSLFLWWCVGNHASNYFWLSFGSTNQMLDRSAGRDILGDTMPPAVPVELCFVLNCLPHCQ